MISVLHNIKTGEVHETDPHQIQAYSHLVNNNRAALFLGMSLSKTVIALSYLYDMHYREAAFCRTLVIAPSKVANITWPDEVNTWAHLKGMRYSVITGTPKQRDKALAVDAEVYIIGVDNLVWLIRKYIHRSSSGKWVGRLPFDSSIIDELSIFKSRDSDRFKAWRRATKTIEYRIGMTGTPVPNGYVDLWAQIVVLDDGERLGDTFSKFVDTYFTTRGNGMIIYEYRPKLGAAKAIASKIEDIALTMSTEDYIKLPRMIIKDIVLEFNDFDREIYEELEREYTIDFLDGGEVTIKTPADLTNKLLQVSSGAIYEDREAPEDKKVWHEINTTKIDALGNLLDTYPGESFIVVYQFRHEVDRIKARFPYAREFRKGKAAKEDFDAWNRKEIKLLLIHPAGAGHGLNLQFGGCRMVWFSQTWNLEHWLQTTRRLKRRGVDWDIFMYRFIVKGTRDIKVCKRVESKEDDQTFLLNEVKELRKKHGR